MRPGTAWEDGAGPRNRIISLKFYDPGGAGGWPGRSRFYRGHGRTFFFECYLSVFHDLVPRSGPSRAPDRSPPPPALCAHAFESERNVNLVESRDPPVL